ncbi:hypothetical protein ACFPKZ_15945 [Streptosporangium amethystogenes subsp. fukuiense]|uniref:hypothetical protein n=1 Tax=Streptosporangium amethystogenes TaxID=2002 RepID=UPI00361C20BD
MVRLQLTPATVQSTLGAVVQSRITPSRARFTVRLFSAENSPPRQSSQPMTNRGRWNASSAPRMGNAVPATSSGANGSGV